MTEVHLDSAITGAVCEDQSPSPCRRSSFGQFIYKTIINAAYNMKHNNLINIPFLQREILHLGVGDENAHFLGKKYGPGEEYKFQREFQNTIWFSYRSNIKGIGDDSGWGCMIRAAQMLLAHVLRKTLAIGSSQVIEYFRENQNSLFSLTNICKKGNLKRQWAGSSNVICICKEIIETDLSLNLTIISNSLGLVNLDQVKKSLVNQQKSVLLSLHCQLGIDKIDEQLVPYLKTLMTFPQFSGCLGGTPGNALYLLGYQKDLMICLDPHYVQQANTGEQTFFKTHPRGIHYNKLVGSICINFLLHNNQECDNFILRLIKLNEKFKGRPVLTVQLNENAQPQFELSESDSDDQDYEVIGE